MKNQIFNFVLLTFISVSIVRAQTSPIEIVHDATNKIPHIKMVETGGSKQAAILQFSNIGDSIRYFSIHGKSITTHPELNFNFRDSLRNLKNVLSLSGTDQRVGIGTSDPKARLDVHGALHISGHTGRDISIETGRPLQIGHYDGVAFLERIRLTTNGNVGIGVISPKEKLDVDGAIHISGGTGRDLSIPTNQNFQFGHYDGNIFTERLEIDQNGRVGIGVDPEKKLDVNGDAKIRGEMEVENRLTVVGSDLAERFEINIPEHISESIPSDFIQAGLVVSIDKKHAGHLILSHEEFDKKVAGIVSGAGGINTAMVLGQEGTLADGDFPVAITGRVYCWVDATYGAVKAGDFLTTSSTPGHAMKVLDYEKARGAVLGKAMTELTEGKGLVLVLVGLQ